MIKTTMQNPQLFLFSLPSPLLDSLKYDISLSPACLDPQPSVPDDNRASVGCFVSFDYVQCAVAQQLELLR